MKIWEADVLNDDLLTTTTTDASGHYSVTVSGDDPTGEAEVYIQFLARTEGASIFAPSIFGGNTYNVLSDTLSGVSGNVTIDLQVSNTTDIGNAFSVLDALVTSSRYVDVLTGSMLSQIEVEFPNGKNGSGYCGDTIFDFEGFVNCGIFGRYISIEQADWYDWDVIQHEYGHYVSDHFNLGNNPGGCHEINVNLTLDTHCGGHPIDYSKSEATRLAWGEGWPTYFALSLQQELNVDDVLGIPNAGDPSYDETDEPPGGNFSYSIEEQTPYASVGEDNELSVQRILWDLYDGANETRDKIGLGEQTAWNVLNGANPVHLYDAWEAFTAGKPVKEVAKYGAIFAEHKVAPDPTNPPDGKKVVSGAGDVTFEWEPNGAGSNYRNDDEFIVEFWTMDFSKKLDASDPLTQPKYTVSTEDLAANVFAEVEKAKWLVKGTYTETPVTGPYTGPARVLRFQPGAATAYILDRSGSMFGAPLANAKAAANRGITTMEVGNEVGVVSFSSRASVNFPLALITGNSVRQAARTSVSSFSAGGTTSIGAGLLAGCNMLKGSNATERDYVLLSDGEQNTPPAPSDVIGCFQDLNAPTAPQRLASVRTVSTLQQTDPEEGQVNHRIHTIAFGTGADQELMAELASQTGGLFFYTPTRTDPLALATLFATIQGEISGEQRLGSFEGALSAPGSASHTFAVTPDIAEETITLLWDDPGDAFTLSLVRPDGTVITPANWQNQPGVTEVTGPGIRYFTVFSPADGEWTARVKAESGSAQYALSLTAQSSVKMNVSFDRRKYYAGQSIGIRARLTGEAMPLLGAAIEVEVRAPSTIQSRIQQQLLAHKEQHGVIEEDYTPKAAVRMAGKQVLVASHAEALTLFDDGQHGDGAAGDGVYGNFYTNTSGVGSYSFSISASGMTNDGASFTRLARRTAYVAPADEEAPVLVSPADGQTGVSLSPMLVWRSVQDAASYQVQVDETLSFSSPLISEAGISDTSYVARGLLRATTYVWRVRARIGGSYGDWSFARSFTTTTNTTADTTPPEITVNAPVTLWPPHHQYEVFDIAGMVASVTDNRAGSIPIDSVRVVSVSSDEPEDSPGDGDTINDIIISADFRSVQFRSERQGEGNGRVYLVTLGVQDPSGNIGTAVFRVEVPHDQNGEAIDDGPAYTVEGYDFSAPAVAALQQAAQAEAGALPEAFELGPAYPNPFTRQVTIPLLLPEQAEVHVAIYDITGRRVRVPMDGALEAGRHPLVFRADGLASGLYLVRAQVESASGAVHVFTDKVVLVR